MRAWGAWAPVVVAAGLFVAGCGADGEPPAAAPTQATSSAAPTPSARMLASTTVAAESAPPGATLVELHGPPPVIIPDEVTAPAGAEVVFFLDNTSAKGEAHGTHTLVIGPSLGTPLAASEQVPAAASAVFTVTGLEPGTYQVWCSFRDHAGLGQVGTLTVR